MRHAGESASTGKGDDMSKSNCDLLFEHGMDTCTDATIKEFLEYLQQQDIELCTLEKSDYLPLTIQETQTRIYEFIGIDPVELEAERKALLKRNTS